MLNHVDRSMVQGSATEDEMITCQALQREGRLDCYIQTEVFVSRSSPTAFLYIYMLRTYGDLLRSAGFVVDEGCWCLTVL